MMLRQIPLFRFFADLEKHVEAFFDDEEATPFTLVLGAGASRSAGIPVTSEMIELLQLYLKLEMSGLPAEIADTIGNDFSELIAELYNLTDEWAIRDFFRLCIRRGSREPNLVHLIAANLACLGVFKTVITTNFDDLALAAF